jgi:uncharacterized protein (DUF58 family)
MSLRARVVLGLFALCLAGGLITGRDAFFNLTYVWGGLFLGAFLWSRTALSGLSLERTPHSLRSQVGLAFEEGFLLHNRSRFPKLWLEIRDQSDFPGHRASLVVVGQGAHRDRPWLVRTLCTRRGRFHLGPVTLVSGDPFGLFPMSMVQAQTHQVVVLPMAVSLPTFPIPSGRLPGGEALMERTHQITPNAAGVRDYMPGDSFSRIHWRSTARRRRLIVKEFELDPMADVWIILDAYAAVQRTLPTPEASERPTQFLPSRATLQPSTLEYAVSAAASLTHYLLERDRAVGFTAYGRSRHALQPDRGASQLYRILETLAVLDGQGDLSLADVLKLEAPQLPRGAVVVLITPDVGEEVLLAARQLKRRALPPVLVLLDGASFGGAQGALNAAVAAQKSGLPVRLVRCGEPLAACLSQGVLAEPVATAA